jgi:SAM-dependent methyltransferase
MGSEDSGDRTSGMDPIAARNRRFWDRLVRDGNVYTRPWLDLDIDMLRAFAAGDIEVLPEPYAYVYPPDVFEHVAGKRVLCLATGGGQQSAVFGLLEADVTVLDLSEGQLAADRRTADHYGYEVNLIHGDMRDLSALPEGAFDLVYQAISMVFVPDPREVYGGVARVLRSGGLYRLGACNPATEIVEESSWDGSGYRILEPYAGGRIVGADAFEFRHLLSDTFNGLVEAGLMIRGVWEDPRHLSVTTGAAPGTYEHMLGFVGVYFAIVAERT